MVKKADMEPQKRGPPEADRQERERPFLGMLAESVGFHLRMAQDASFAHFADQLGASGLRPGRFALLEIIGENPDISQQELSEVSGRDKSTTSIILRDLERQKLIARRRDEQDRRTARITLTGAGQDQLLSARYAAAIHEDALDSILGEKKSEFISMLRDICNGLDRAAPP